MCEQCDFIAARGGVETPELTRQFRQTWRRRTRQMIADRGVAIVSVDDVLQPFSYTIGLWSTRGHPELVIFGLQPPVAHGTLNSVAARIRVGGSALGDGDEVATPDRDLLAFRLPNPGQVILQANFYFRRPAHRSVPALQLMYPDVHGTWPWEPDCHLFPGQQPMPGEFVA